MFTDVCHRPVRHPDKSRRRPVVQAGPDNQEGNFFPFTLQILLIGNGFLFRDTDADIGFWCKKGLLKAKTCLAVRHRIGIIEAFQFEVPGPFSWRPGALNP